MDPKERALDKGSRHIFHELGGRMRSFLRSDSLNKGLEGGELGMRAHFLRELHAEENLKKTEAKTHAEK